MNDAINKAKITFLTDRMILGHGVDLVIDNLARQLQKQGYAISVYCNHFDRTFTSQADYEIFELAPIAARNTLELERRLKQERAVFNEIDTDVFMIHSFPFYCLAGLLDKPVLAINYGVINTTGMPFKRSLFYKYMDFMQNNFYFKRADKLISISNFLHGLLPKKIRSTADIVYLGADHYKANIPSGQIAAFRKSMQVSEDEILLLYVGRLNVSNQPYKGVAALKDLYHILHKKDNRIKLLMAGYGSKNDEEFLKNEGILAIANAQSHQMPLLYSACDIYTTATKWEGFDLPLLEAQSFARPAVCYDVGAHREVTCAESAFLVKDPDGFVEKVLTLAQDQPLRQKMGRSALTFAQKFNWENTAGQYERHLKELLGNSGQEIKKRPKANKQISKKEDSGKLSALVIHYNASYPCLKECIGSLAENAEMDIFLFDNGSSNDAAARVAREFKKVRVLSSKTNLGLGGAINEAIKQIDSTYVLITSFDIVLKKNAIAQMLSALDNLQSPYIGIAPKTLFYHDRNYIENVGCYLDNAFYIGNTGMGQLDLGQYDRSEDILSPSFTCAMIRRDAFNFAKVGALDETFFLFYEEVDFAYRAALRGYKFRSCPQAVCYHKYAYSFRDDATAYAYKYYYQRLNLLRTAYKNAEDATLQRITANELAIQKNNLKDKNLKEPAKRILSDYKKSLPSLKKHRRILQGARKCTDENVLSYSWGEHRFFDIVTNKPLYSLENIHDSFLRLFVCTRDRKYLDYIHYIDKLSKVRLRMDPAFLSESLTDLFKDEQDCVKDFIKRM